jgi:hypothetical protein
MIYTLSRNCIPAFDLSSSRARWLRGSSGVSGTPEHRPKNCRITPGLRHHLLRRPARHQPPTTHATIRPQINNPVRRLDHIHVVFDHQHRIALVHQLLIQHAVRLASGTRPGSDESSPKVNKYVRWGAGPRASQYLVLGAKARAALAGRAAPDLDDLRDMALPVLRHRMVLNFQGEAEGVRLEQLLGPMLEKTR